MNIWSLAARHSTASFLMCPCIPHSSPFLTLTCSSPACQDAEQAGGQKYATIAALTYRQIVAGTKLVWNPKENKLW